MLRMHYHYKHITSYSYLITAFVFTRPLVIFACRENFCLNSSDLLPGGEAVELLHIYRRGVHTTTTTTTTTGGGGVGVGVLDIGDARVQFSSGRYVSRYCCPL